MMPKLLLAIAGGLALGGVGLLFADDTEGVLQGFGVIVLLFALLAGIMAFVDMLRSRIRR